MLCLLAAAAMIGAMLGDWLNERDRRRAAAAPPPPPPPLKPWQ